jgi:hypothetical protein
LSKILSDFLKKINGLQKNLQDKLAKVDSSGGMIADEQREEVKNFELDFQTSEQQVAVRKVTWLIFLSSILEIEIESFTIWCTGNLLFVYATFLYNN